MAHDTSPGVEVADVSGSLGGDDTAASAMSIFDANGDVLVKLGMPNGAVVGSHLRIIHDAYRKSLEGHMVVSCDYRTEFIDPKSLICNVQENEDSLSVRFDDSQNPAFWGEVLISRRTRNDVERLIEMPEADRLRKLGDVAFIRRPKRWQHRPFLPLTHLQEMDDHGLAAPALLTAQYVDQPLVFPVNLYDTPQFGGEMTPDEIMKTAMAYSSVDRMLDEWTVD